MEQFTTWLTQYGFTQQMILFLLYIPVIATVVNASRYVVGMKMYGIYAPVILAFAYYFTGVKFGLLVTVAVILATLLTYTILRKIRMHYLSRIAINYTVISFFIIGIIILNEISPIQLTDEDYMLTAVTPLGLVLIATLSDFFIKQYVKKSFIVTMRSLIETVIVALIGWGIIILGLSTDGTINPFGEFLLTQIWIYPVLVLLNVFIGQYAGLRLKDFSRFKRVWQNS